MNRIGFDNDKYLKLQSEKIRERINSFGGKLYMEFGGKLFDDFHASRVLPGFEPENIKPLLITLLNDLDDYFPAKIIVWSEWNHEKLYKSVRSSQRHPVLQHHEYKVYQCAFWLLLRVFPDLLKPQPLLNSSAKNILPAKTPA